MPTDRWSLTVPVAGLMLLLGAVTEAAAQGARLRVVDGDSSIDLSAAATASRVAPANPRVTRALKWRTVRPGLAVATLELRAGGRGVALQAVVVRMEPARYRLALQQRVEENGMTGTWTTDSAGAGAALALNAGQFRETGPWGWLVLEGYEHRSPGRGPLAAGVRIDTAGRAHWVARGDERDARQRPDTRYAFQSFPVLFMDRQVPPPLRAASTNQTHRDARLVMAECDDGSLLFVMSRYAGLGPIAERVPIGLTTPESVLLAGALGARHALMLDGGGSAQLMVRDASGHETHWRGLRRVPLGLVATPRAGH